MTESSDIKAHQATYHSLLLLLRWGAVGCFLIAFLVIWLLS